MSSSKSKKFTSPARVSNVQQLFEQQVEKTPSQTALVFNNFSLNYDELNQKANQLARFIRSIYAQQYQCNLPADTLIAFCCPRSWEMVVCMLAILKSGAAHIGLDPDLPTSRMQYILEDAKPSFILTSTHMNNFGAFNTKRVVNINDNQINKQKSCNLRQINSECDLSYVIYTSGSTGRPKGVTLTHRGLVNLVIEHQKHFSVDSKVKVLQFASINFDASIWEIYPALCYGAELYIATEDVRLSPKKLCRFLCKHKINMATIPPVVLTNMPKEQLPHLKTLVVAGDTCPEETVQYWCRQRRFINAYGPSEATVCATMGELSEKSNVRNIGKALGGVTCYVLNKHYMPVACGEVGELYITGLGLSRGYLNNPTLTHEGFIDNPFVDHLHSEHEEKLYKTGDLVRLLADSSLEYIGRSDLQVKLRGFRIELSEIEHALMQYHAVKQAVVIDFIQNKQKYLAAYYTVHIKSNGKEKLSAEDLSHYLGEFLPSYMIPNVWMVLEEMPITVNGKIDRSALPNAHLVSAATYSEPTNKIEKKLQKIWCDVLAMPNVGTKDNFFQLGGCSLGAARIATGIQDLLKTACTPVSILQYPTIQDWYDNVYHCSKPSHAISSYNKGTTTELPLSWVQDYFYYHEMTYGSEFVFNEQFTINMECTDPEILQKAINFVVARHPVFRHKFYFDKKSGRAMQTKVDNVKVGLSYYDFSKCKNTETAYKTKTQEMVVEKFYFTNPPLIRFALFKIHQNHYKLFCVFHRILADGTSVYNILIPELSYLYLKIRNNQSVTLPSLEYDYNDYVRYYEGNRKHRTARHAGYWRSMLTVYKPTQLPPCGEKMTESRHGNILKFKINEPMTSALRSTAKLNQVSLFSVLLSVYYMTISAMTGHTNLCVGTVLHGREQREFENVFGVMFDGIVLMATLEMGMSFVQMVKKVHSNNIETFSKAIPFDDLLKIYQDLRLKGKKKGAINPYDEELIKMAFSLEPRESQHDLNWQVNQLEAHAGTSPCDFYMELDEKYCTILVRIEYNVCLYNKSYINRFKLLFESIMEKVLAHPDKPTLLLEIFKPNS